jgi:hypothetical protein
VRVIWTEGLLAGCAFVDPVSTGAVSAAQLKAPIDSAGVDARLPAATAGQRLRVDNFDREQVRFERTIGWISALISVVALVIFLAAIELL